MAGSQVNGVINLATKVSQTQPNEQVNVSEEILCFLLALFIVYPIAMWLIVCVRKSCLHDNVKNMKLRGLHLPNGSIRAMLAIAIVGSFLIYLADGGSNKEILVAFGTLSGAVTGFYFSGRSATLKPEDE